MAHFEAEHTLIQINISNLECIERYKILLLSFLEYHRIISYYILKLKKRITHQYSINGFTLKMSVLY